MNFIKTNIAGIASEIKTGKTPPTSNPEYFRDEINWYTPGDLDKGKFLSKSQRRISKKAIDDKKAVIFKPNTLLIGCIGDIGKIGITTGVSSSNQQLTGLLPDDKKVTTEYLYYWLKSKKKLFQNTSTNAIVPILNNRQLGSIKISIPENLSYQIFITDILSKAENLISQRKQSIALLDEFLKSTFLEMFGDPVWNEKMWVKLKLSDVCTKIGSGATPRGGKESYHKSGMSLIRSLNVHNDIFLYKDLALIDDKQAEELKNVNVEGNDVLLNITGASVARCCIVPSQILPARVNQHVSIVRPNPNILNPVFLSRMFTSNACQSFLIRNSKSKGATREAITKDEIERLEVIVPNIELQIRFAQIVEKTEAIKAQYQISLQELENLYGSLSQRAFRGELTLGKHRDIIINV